MGTSKLLEKPDKKAGWYLDLSIDGLGSHPGGVAILLVASCYGGNHITYLYFNEVIIILSVEGISGDCYIKNKLYSFSCNFNW